MKAISSWLGALALMAGTLPALGADPKLDSDADRAVAYANLNATASQYVLTSDEFPKFDLAEREQARALLGDYQLKPAFYGPDYKSVTKATEPGRYGVVLEVVPAA